MELHRRETLCVNQLSTCFPSFPPGSNEEFSNADGEEYPSEFSAQGSPATQNGPEVYILPLTEVSLPMSRQPGRSDPVLQMTA
ncbi:Serine/threonine-protein kinase LMTK1, partial [Ophiophagus hannah]